ncbi:MAG: hypothetical protein CMO80_16745 [Verrucomicrobiales bacterium]|nr:hypothetical protein [Verrucomicrobiales bacterium]
MADRQDRRSDSSFIGLTHFQLLRAMTLDVVLFQNRLDWLNVAPLQTGDQEKTDGERHHSQQRVFDLDRAIFIRSIHLALTDSTSERSAASRKQTEG